ncbi:DUF4397 domain-containing protein [Arthrobacter ruber]|uniref:DUF4397 domain-containing protein n=1 Tax=Arthrobacter ruber TaxID=1258893 RepID=UPI000CF37889|nr:DUF4397 domain-containing protein [Arthrobacter ruber]
MTAHTQDSPDHAASGTQPAARTTRLRTTRGMLAVVVAAAMYGAVSAAPAVAAEEPQTSGGWARVAHLSPDTKTVDVELTAVAGGEVLFELEDVAYGDVSEYLRLPAGTFVVDMTPADSAPDTDPALSQLITVQENQPVTLAVLGKNADLTAKVIVDDLTAPEDGRARIRVLQASTLAETVDIQTIMGDPIAVGAKSGQVTGYATVDAGPWELQLFKNGERSLATVDLLPGSVNTLLVLDNASGGLTIKPISDSATVTDTPVGGTNTGSAPLSAGPRDSAATGSASPWHVAPLVAAGLAAVVVVARGASQGLLPVPVRRRP